ncbi:MAG: hydroxymethylbilane synthase [Alphaproteobacteria bacterium]
MSHVFRIATRQSKMALFQANMVADALRALHSPHTFDLLPMTSEGCYDRFKGDLATIGGKGAFVRGLEKVMLVGDAHMAMHSLKDIPTDEELPAGLTIPCVLPRDDNRDAVVCRVGESIKTLKAGSNIGTSSVRRAAQLKRLFPQHNIVALRGNADTRVGKVDHGTVDAAILTSSGLARIGLAHRITDIFEQTEMLPAVGQGVIAVECPTNNPVVLDLLARINHQPTFTCITAERSMLTALGGSCHTPIAGWCRFVNEATLELKGLVASLDGQTMLTAQAQGPASNPAALGAQVAASLLAQGAREVLDACTAAA